MKLFIALSDGTRSGRVYQLNLGAMFELIGQRVIYRFLWHYLRDLVVRLRPVCTRALVGADWFAKGIVCSYGAVSPLSVSSRTITPNIIFGFMVFLSLIWLFLHVSLYIWNFPIVFMKRASFVMCSTSIISSMWPMECLFSSRFTANFDLLLTYL
jgi:hypothetical protein